MVEQLFLHPIPIHAAARIAGAYGYDQVVVLARRIGEHPEPCGEHVTTFGVDEQHCAIAARVGAALRHFMAWPALTTDDPVVSAYRQVAIELASAGRTFSEATSAVVIAEVEGRVDRAAGMILKARLP